MYDVPHMLYIDVHRRGTGVHMRERQVGEGGKEGEGQKYRQNRNKFKSFS